MIQSCLYNGLVVYAPALAMEKVAGLNVNVGIVVVGTVCILYTSFGGMKAVVWSDVFQSIWMVSGFLVIVTVCAIDFGGFGNLMAITKSGGRTEWLDFEIDPRYRHTFWSVVIGNCTGAEMASFTCQQYKVQRYLSCKTLTEAQKCVFISILTTAIISILALFITVIQIAND